MSNRYLNNRDEVPNGGFRYHQQETNFTVTAPSWKDLIQRVKAHREANVLPVGGAFSQEIENWLCSQLPPQSCTEHDPNRSPEVPRDAWPIYIKMIALKAEAGDKGVGDTIARVIGPIGGDSFKRWFAEVFGRSCGCDQRQDSLNLQFPYK